MEPPLPFPTNMSLLTGPRVLGIILNWYLHGLLTVQYILYLIYSRKDRAVLKITVHFLFLINSAQIILTMSDAFFWFVYGFGDRAKLFQFHFATIDVPTLDAIIALVVQSIYCWRIWTLSRWRTIPALAMLVALLAAVCGFITGIRDISNPGRVVVQDASHRVPIMIWLIASAVTDVIIAASMAYILLKAKNDAIGLQRSTGQKILRLLILILETNALTAAIAVEVVITFFTTSISPPRSFIYEVGGYALGKLYTNCFMVLLYQREGHGASWDTDSTVELGTMPDFATDSEATYGDITSGISSFSGTGRHRGLRKFTTSKPRNIFTEGEDELRSHTSLPSMQFARAEDIKSEIEELSRTHS